MLLLSAELYRGLGVIRILFLYVLVDVAALLLRLIIGGGERDVLPLPSLLFLLVS